MSIVAHCWVGCKRRNFTWLLRHWYNWSLIPPGFVCFSARISQGQGVDGPSSAGVAGVLERSEALVLRDVDFSQSSRIVTFLCPVRGRMACMVKGIRRPRSVLAGLLDTYRRLEIVYTWKDSRGVQQLTDCSLLEAYDGVREDLEKSMYAALPLELAYTVAHENEPSHGLYAALVAGLEGLERWTGDVRLYSAWFIVRLLSASGFAPSVRSCYSCGGEVSAAPGFSYEGGVTCGRCASDRALTPEAYTALSAISESEAACPASAEAGAEVFETVCRYASRQLDHDFRSTRVLEQMFGRAEAARPRGEQ